MLMQGYVPKLINCFMSLYVPEGGGGGGGGLSRNDADVAYTCPEYARDEAALMFDEKCDNYSFGVILMELLSGQSAQYHKKDNCAVAYDIWSDAKIANSLWDLAKRCTTTRSARIGSSKELLRLLKDIQDSASSTLTTREQELVNKMGKRMMMVKSKLESQRSTTFERDNYDSEDSDLSEDSVTEFVFNCSVCHRAYFDESVCVPCSGQIDKHSMCKRCFCDEIKLQTSGDLEQFKSNGRKVVCPLCICAKPKKRSVYIPKVIYNCGNDVAMASYLKALNETEEK